MLYAASEPSDPRYMPSVGNGFIATVLGSNSSYLSGVFNSAACGTYRARLPASSLLRVQGAMQYASALDLRSGTFYRRMRAASTPGLELEYAAYGHADAALRGLLVVTLTLDCASCSQAANITVESNDGGPTTDFAMHAVPAPPGLQVTVGSTT